MLFDPLREKIHYWIAQRRHIGWDLLGFRLPSTSLESLLSLSYLEGPLDNDQSCDTYQKDCSSDLKLIPCPGKAINDRGGNIDQGLKEVHSTSFQT